MTRVGACSSHVTAPAVLPKFDEDNRVLARTVWETRAALPRSISSNAKLLILFPT